MSTYGFTVNCDGNAQIMMAKINASLEGMGSIAQMETAKVKTAFSGLGGMFGGLKSMLLGGLGFGAAFEGVALIKNSVSEFNELANANAKINAALLSTQGIAGKTFEGLSKSAEALGSKIMPDDAIIKDAQSMLLTFTAVKDAVYDDAIPAIADFATRFKMELPEAANQVGKALNDPLKGMTRLQRQGVVFTDAQKEVIKKFVETGQVAKAQQVIIKELNTEFGGLAEAMAKTPQGQAAMAYKEWEWFRLGLGEFVMMVKSKVLPVFINMMDGLKEFVQWIKEGGIGATIFKDVFIVVGAAVLLFYTYTTLAAIGTKLWAAAQWLLNAAMTANPIGIIIVGITALVAVIAVLWDKCEGFRKIMGAVFETVKKYVIGMVNYFVNLGKIIGDVFTMNWGKLKTDSQSFISDFKNDFTTGWADAIKKGTEEGAKSTFKFGNLLNFGAGQTGASANSSSDSGNAIKQNALNTSELGGAKGGLGESKIINIKIDTMQRIESISGIKDLKNASEDAIEVLIRAINNLAYSQSATM